jgi:broad specificity phosphatase PhoE
MLSEFNEFDHADIVRRSESKLSRPVRWADAPDSRNRFRADLHGAMSLWIEAAHDGYEEPFSDFKKRCLRGFFRIVESALDEEVWMFTSAGPILAIILQLLNMPDSRMCELTSMLANSSVSKVAGEDWVTQEL